MFFKFQQIVNRTITRAWYHDVEATGLTPDTFVLFFYRIVNSDIIF